MSIGNFLRRGVYHHNMKRETLADTARDPRDPDGRRGPRCRSIRRNRKEGSTMMVHRPTDRTKPPRRATPQGVR